MGRKIVLIQNVIMDQKEHIRELLRTMDETASSMTEIIFMKYFDNVEPKQKYLLAMYDDTFKTVSVFCQALSKVALTQAGDMLRKLIEQVAILNVLIDHPEKLSKFVEHYKLRKEIWDKSKSQQITIVSQKFGVQDDPRALTYLDYGWVSNKCNETQLLLEAGFSDMVSWKKMFLDKFVHSSYTNVDLAGEHYDYPIIQHLVEIASKCFDNLCCSFHKLTNFDFVIDKRDMFQGEFRPLYEQFKIKHE